ncbi:capsid protein [Prosthecomicrobium hirschii]|uniref:Capsid protein n=2 Tax=Prosthecodimorpha hirschii TaxID=665126 RepID=A0A0P6VXL8_9HYPH|nr:capsid protein [Prosthecomicrobium hirschii]
MKAPAVGAIELKDDPEGGDPAAIVTKALAELKGSIEGRLLAIESKASDLGKITTRLDAVETKLARPAIGGKTQAEGDEAAQVEQKAFRGFLRQGREALSADEIKTLRVADDTAGGYLAPAQFVNEVIKGIVQFSPVRQAARVGSTTSGSVVIPKRTGRPTAVWVGETETRTGTEPTYGQAEIPVNEMAFYIDVSTRLLEDAAVNIESEISMDAAEEAGRLEGAAFVSGDGVKRPLGFMSDTGVSYTANGHATTLSADPLITLMYAMPAFYRNRGAWMMNGSTLATVRKLKDGQGNYLWQPSYQAGQPETLLGRPVIEAVDMPDIASNAYPIVFGDFSTGYRIYDRVSLSVMRDPYSVATSGLVRFHFRRRVGGSVVLSEAIRKLKMAVS